MKQCYTCKTEKPLSEFQVDNSKPDNLSIYCRGCIYKIGKKTYAKHKENIKRKRRNKYYNSTEGKNYYKNIEKQKQKKIDLENSQDIKDIIKQLNKTHHTCPVCKITKGNDKFVTRIYKGEIKYNRCKKCNAEAIYKSIKKRLKTDSFFKLQMTLRGRVATVFKQKGYKKTSKTQDLLGADFETVKNHLEKQFEYGMTWDNNTIKGWHIDHIIPLSSAKTKKELIKLFHYTNLQPLWAFDNMSKSNKILKK